MPKAGWADGFGCQEPTDASEIESSGLCMPAHIYIFFGVEFVPRGVLLIGIT